MAGDDATQLAVDLVADSTTRTSTGDDFTHHFDSLLI
jgi:hypothetical protein